jgi:hypothetical protein
MFRAQLAILLLASAISLVGSASPDPATLIVPPSELAQARHLVQQLGSEEFNEREEAEAALQKMGRLAFLALLEGVNTDPNPEIRFRCSRLMPLARTLETKARLETFLADVDGKYDHALPGWRHLQTLVSKERFVLGGTASVDRSLEKAARAVFVDLISNPINKKVVMAAESPSDDITAILITRWQELHAQRNPPPVPGMGGGVAPATVPRKNPTAEEIAALLLLGSVTTKSPARIPGHISISLLVTTSDFPSRIRGQDDTSRVYKAIALVWLDTRTDPIDLYQGMIMASNLGLNESSVQLAARLFATKGSPAAYRGSAAGTLSNFGSKEHIPLLEMAFEDKEVIASVRNKLPGNAKNEIANCEIQVRDVALVVAILLTGQAPGDYGFVDQQKSSEGSPGVVHSYTRYYIANEKRTAAFELWKDWWARNKGK